MSTETPAPDPRSAAASAGSSVLRASGLGKRYPLGPRGIRSLVRAALGREDPNPGRWALKDVDLEVPSGGALGVVGRNGAGKSTLLRCLAGTARPTVGQVTTAGDVGCLLDLGVGFHPLDSGRENAIAALVLQGGRTRPEATQEVRAVGEYAGIGAHFDRPMRTYSAGMYLRVAFAVQARLQPDILITDEVITVGDAAFQRRCTEYFDEFRGRGGTLVLCAHDTGQIVARCDRAIWLDCGEVRATGDAATVVRAYLDDVAEQGGESAGITHGPGVSAGLPFEVRELELRSDTDRVVHAFRTGETVEARVAIHAKAGIPQVFVGIDRSDGVPVYGVASDMEGGTPRQLDAETWEYRLRFPDCPLLAGRYHLRGHALDETGTRLYDTVQIVFDVEGPSGAGLIDLDGTWE